MEALKNLITNVPDWLKKLDELNGQIEQRQIELAKLGDEKTNSTDGRSLGGPKSVRNKGSTESLRPRDEPAAHPTDPRPQTDAENAATPNNGNTEQAAPPSPSESQSPSEIQRQKSQMRAAGQARARATLRKRQRTDSVISAEGATPKYRSRCMIIVYYDSYVQLFFEELVKFVSAGRNMMRKAKMAAKVAQIKRLAELETPDDQSDAPASTSTSTIPATSTTSSAGALVADGPIVAVAADATAATNPSSKPAEATTDELQPAIHFVSTRRMGPGAGGRVMRPGMYPRVGGAGSRAMRSGGGAGGPGYMLGSAAGGDKAGSSDVYDELDRGLEYVQSMCEHAAHQFLRDGDCGEEVANIKRRLAETKELADREMERVRREDPDALAKIAAAGAGDDATGVAAARSYRPQSMRKVVGKPAGAAAAAASTSTPAAGTGTGTGAGSTTPTPALDESAGPLEVDEGVGDVDGEAMPKLVWKSTRMMR